MKRHIANIITVIRIICSLLLLACDAFSLPFYVLYLIAGFTDMIDGTVARKTGSESELGARLDTAADFVLIVVCLKKLLPVLSIEGWILIWICVIAIIKAINIISGIIMYKRIITVHSLMNKITGALLFVFPLTIGFIEIRYSVAVLCAVATFAAIKEGHEIRTGKY
ncbi:MAG: CDP-alcohol phosphatidyltransferase family protein [Eubacteriales bacterium]|nr:CDP-alcohol phosphatidyltransferase family protein [Eubacteriales bacterium]